MGSAELRHLELRSRALELDMRQRRVELTRLCAATQEADLKRHRSAEQFNEIKNQLLQLRLGTAQSISRGDVMHQAESLAERLTAVSKVAREDALSVRTLQQQAQAVGLEILRDQSQISVLGERARTAQRQCAVISEEQQSQEIVEIATQHRDGGAVLTMTCPDTVTGRELSGCTVTNGLPASKRVGGKSVEPKSKDLHSTGAQSSQAHSVPEFAHGLAVGGPVPMFEGRQHQFDGQAASTRAQQADASAAGGSDKRLLEAAFSPALESKIRALQSWDNLAGQGVEFSLGLESGKRLEVEISASPGGAVQVLLEPERSRDRYALWRQRSEIAAALAQAGCEVRGVTVRGRS